MKAKGLFGATGPTGATGATGATGSGSSDSILGQPGIGGAQISGLQASPDINNATGANDEFDAALSGWTTLGAPDTLDANSTFKSNCYIQKNAGTGVNCVGIYKAYTPSAGDIWACKVTDTLSSTYDFQKAGGIFVGLATPGNMIGVYWGLIGGSVNVTVFSTPTTFTTNLFASGNTGWQANRTRPKYFAIRYNSSTSIDLFTSVEGLVWLRVTTAFNPGFTIGSIGLFISVENASTGVGAAFDWIRKIPSIKDFASGS